ncbi:MAG TPA: helix-turn-helix domain-containing protein [Pseudidiomarina sp.]|nr:helix-turn-helix domain-containing protein [Pseudidiomarina sp.]
MFVPVNNSEAIGRCAKAVRKLQHIDQSTLAAFADCGITFVSQFENGKPTVQLEKVLQVLDALGIKVYLDMPEQPEELGSELKS